MSEKFSFKELITSIEWSPDDCFIMIVLSKVNQIHIRCLESEAVVGGNQNWYTKIDEGVIGLAG
jgi:hypothetical protein